MVSKYNIIEITSYEDFIEVYNTEEYLFNMRIYKNNTNKLSNCSISEYMSFISFIDIIKNNNYNIDILSIYDIFNEYIKYYDEWNTHLIKKLCILSLSLEDKKLFTFLKKYDIYYYSNQSIHYLTTNTPKYNTLLTTASDKLFLSIFYLFHIHLDKMLIYYENILSTELKKSIEINKIDIYKYIQNSIVKPYKKIIYTYFTTQIFIFDIAKKFITDNINICSDINTYNRSHNYLVNYSEKLIKLIIKMIIFENYFEPHIIVSFRNFINIYNKNYILIEDDNKIILYIINFAYCMEQNFKEFCIYDTNNTNIISIDFFNDIIRSIDTMDNIVNIYDRIPIILKNFTTNKENNIYKILTTNFNLYMTDLKKEFNKLINKYNNTDRTDCIQKIIHYVLLELNIVNKDYLKDFNNIRLNLSQFRYISLYKYLVNKPFDEINNIVNMTKDNITLFVLKNKRTKILEHITLLESFNEKLKDKIKKQNLVIVTTDSIDNIGNSKLDISL